MQLLLIPVLYGVFGRAWTDALAGENVGGLLGRAQTWLPGDFDRVGVHVGWSYTEYVAFRIRHVLSLLALGIVALHLAIAGAVWRREVFAYVTGWIQTPGSAANLAMFRIIFYACLPLIGLLEVAIKNAGLPSEMLAPLTGWGWLFRLVPPSTPVLEATSWIVLCSCALAAVGFFTRSAQVVCLIASFYAFTTFNSYGAFSHIHHLLWFQVILLLSPCADVFSVDAMRFRRNAGGTAPAPSVRYGFPIRLIWILFGVIYFFPGLWKWRTAGWDWAVGQNLVNILHHRWHELEWVPAWRVDTVPLLSSLGGLGVIFFELTFIFAIFHRYTRGLYAIAGICFHLGSHFQMQILFEYLLICYPVFIDWEGVREWIWPRAEDREFKPVASERIPRPLLGFGVFLLAGLGYFGVRHSRGNWPIDCYPTFGVLQTPTRVQTMVDITMSDGRVVTLGQSETGRRIGVTPLHWFRAMDAVRRLSSPERKKERRDAMQRVVILRLQSPGVVDIRFREERALIDLTAFEKRAR